MMSSTDTTELMEKLETHFDEKSVQEALTSIETDITDQSINALLRGRGAATLWPRIEQQLKSNLTLRNLNKLSNYVSRSEFRNLLEQIKINEEELLSEIKDRRIPSIKLLSQEQRKRVQNKLQDCLNQISLEEEQVAVAEYLLDHFRTEDTAEFVFAWCKGYVRDKKIIPVLGKLISKIPSAELIQLGEWHLFNSEWTANSDALISSMMTAAGTNQNPMWMELWCDHAQLPANAWVLSQFVLTTKCSRRALWHGIKSFSHSTLDNRAMLIMALARYSQRKAVKRWLHRFLRSNIKSELVLQSIFFILYVKPSRQHCLIAKEALYAASPEWQHKILIDLIIYSSDPELIELAIEDSMKNPNAPDSFTLMCRVSKHTPEVAVPWLLEWISTAMPEQKTEGLAFIVRASKDPEHLQMALNWCATVEQQQLPVSAWMQAILLGAMVKAHPSAQVIRVANQFYENEPDKTLASMKRLARRLAKYGSMN